MPGNGGGEPGDLLLKVAIQEKPGFERKGMDVYTTVQIPYTTAVLGGEALVQTLSGNVLCKIREGTQSGSRIRLKGKGIVSMKDPYCLWRSVCDRTDPGSEKSDAAGKRKTTGV